MATRPPSYPLEASFAALLRWHMDIWGTRPDGSTKRSGKPWTVKEFAYAVHGNGLQPGSAEKNVGNWRDENEAPPRNRTTIEKIEAALFGENPAFDAWKNDLRLARERSSARRRKLPNTLVTHDLAAAALDANPASSTMIESYIEQAERLRSEQRTNARQSAQLLAVEAERCNRTGNYDAGMRFALAGWLATTKEGVECIPEIVRQLEQGARGIRVLLNETGACLHAHMQDGEGNDTFLISRDGKLYAHYLTSGERMEITTFGRWFALCRSGLIVVSQAEDGSLSMLPLTSKIDVYKIVEFIWPSHTGGIIYFTDKCFNQDRLSLSSNGDVLIWSSQDCLIAVSISEQSETIRYKSSELLYSSFNALSSNGDFLVSNLLHSRQAIWDPRSGRMICDLNDVCHDSTRLSWASFTQDGNVVVLRFESGFVYPLSTLDMSLQGRIALHHPLTHSLDGRLLAGCVDNQICVFDVLKSAVIYSESGSLFVNYKFMFSSDNCLLYVQKATTINALKVNEDFGLAFKTVVGDEIHHFKLSDSEAILLTNNLIPDFEYQVYSVNAFDALTGQRLVHLSPSIAIAASPDGTLIAANGDRRTTIYDRTGSIISSIRVRDWQSKLQFSIDRTMLYQLPGIISTDVEYIAGYHHFHIFDVSFRNGSLRELVEFICEVKLAKNGFFLEADLTDALYRNVPFDVVNQCRILLADA